MSPMRVLITGGCGYIGSVLIPKILAAEHSVWVIDTQWFGNHLPAHSLLNVTRGDFAEEFSFDGIDTVIHLAGIANDPCGELDAKLTWETNAYKLAQFAKRCAESGVKQFIYASSGSVYGVSNQLVNEESELVPVSEYNKSKLVAERILLSYADKMAIQIVRPGTCCGYSPRQRLDITVNQFTIQALTKGVIKVGGSHLMRANIHIEDMASVYCFLYINPHLTGIWNAAFDNVSLGDIAKAVSDRLGGRVVEVQVTDPRSYRIDSKKILDAGFSPQFSIGKAIDDLIFASLAGKLTDDKNNYNLIAMPR